jgi:hypothetical protein
MLGIRHAWFPACLAIRCTCLSACHTLKSCLFSNLLLALIRYQNFRACYKFKIVKEAGGGDVYWVLLHNGGFCNGCVTEWIFIFTCKLSLHKKTTIIEKMTKTIDFLKLKHCSLLYRSIVYCGCSESLFRF